MGCHFLLTGYLFRFYFPSFTSCTHLCWDSLSARSTSPPIPGSPRVSSLLPGSGFKISLRFISVLSCAISRLFPGWTRQDMRHPPRIVLVTFWTGLSAAYPPLWILDFSYRRSLYSPATPANAAVHARSGPLISCAHVTTNNNKTPDASRVGTQTRRRWNLCRSCTISFGRWISYKDSFTHSFCLCWVCISPKHSFSFSLARSRSLRLVYNRVSLVLAHFHSPISRCTLAQCCARFTALRRGALLVCLDFHSRFAPNLSFHCALNSWTVFIPFSGISGSQHLPRFTAPRLSLTHLFLNLSFCCTTFLPVGSLFWFGRPVLRTLCLTPFPHFFWTFCGFSAVPFTLLWTRLTSAHSPRSIPGLLRSATHHHLFHHSSFKTFSSANSPVFSFSTSPLLANITDSRSLVSDISSLVGFKQTAAWVSYMDVSARFLVAFSNDTPDIRRSSHHLAPPVLVCSTSSPPGS